MGDIGKGVIELISRHGIRELVMGGALDKHYKEYKPYKMLSINFSYSILVLCIIHCGCLLSIFIASKIKIHTWLLIGPNCRPWGLDYAKKPNVQNIREKGELMNRMP